MTHVRIAMMQMPVIFGAIEENLRTMRDFLDTARGRADICIFPECADIGWANEDAIRLATPIPGTVSDAYASLAREFNVYLAAGLTEAAGELIFNAAVLISPEGEILLHHRKINTLTGVEDMYAIGDRLATVMTPFGRISLDICADNSDSSAVLGETFGRMGTSLLLSPCAWAVRPDRDVEKEPYGEEWHIPYSRLARRYHMAVVGVSNVGIVANGAWRGWKAIGNSIAYDGDAACVAELPYGEDAVCCQVIEIELRVNSLTGTALTSWVGDIR